MKISAIAIYLDIKTDESYTPEVLSIRGGIYVEDLRDIVNIKLEDPNGWIVIPLFNYSNGEERDYIYTMNL